MPTHSVPKPESLPCPWPKLNTEQCLCSQTDQFLLSMFQFIAEPPPWEFASVLAQACSETAHSLCDCSYLEHRQHIETRFAWFFRDVWFKTPPLYWRSALERERWSQSLGFPPSFHLPVYFPHIPALSLLFCFLLPRGYLYYKNVPWPNTLGHMLRSPRLTLTGAEHEATIHSAKCLYTVYAHIREICS